MESQSFTQDQGKVEAQEKTSGLGLGNVLCKTVMVELCHPTLRVAVTMAVKHSANVVKDGVVPFSGLKALMQTQARALLNALNNISVL
ncbi:hypothetical protein TSUD_221920, partial [Trifolium subterraneum]